MFPIAVNSPVVGSKSSAVEVAFPLSPTPPARSTLPFVSSVAVWQLRAHTMFPVAVKTPVEESKISAVPNVVLCRSSPPVTRTLPSPSNVAV